MNPKLPDTPIPGLDEPARELPSVAVDQTPTPTGTTDAVVLDLVRTGASAVSAAREAATLNTRFQRVGRVGAGLTIAAVAVLATHAIIDVDGTPRTPPVMIPDTNAPVKRRSAGAGDADCELNPDAEGDRVITCSDGAFTVKQVPGAKLEIPPGSETVVIKVNMDTMGHIEFLQGGTMVITVINDLFPTDLTMDGQYPLHITAGPNMDDEFVLHVLRADEDKDVRAKEAEKGITLPDGPLLHVYVTHGNIEAEQTVGTNKEPYPIAAGTDGAIFSLGEKTVVESKTTIGCNIAFGGNTGKEAAFLISAAVGSTIILRRKKQ